MRMGLALRATMAAALLGAVALTTVATPASASEDVFTGTVTSSGAVDWSGALDSGGDQARRDGKPLSGRPLVLPGRTRAGVATLITCDVIGLGPSLLGSDVSFSISITCRGGIPQELRVQQDIARHIAPGNWVVEPGSFADCPGYATPLLLCGSVATCFRAGANYDGYAILYGRDEFGADHWATYYASPRWVGCIV
nr:hypothetical protein [Micromonospora sp. DSM 115978]